jgi:hypothetical protein
LHAASTSAATPAAHAMINRRLLHITPQARMGRAFCKAKENE